MRISINATEPSMNIPECMTAEEIQLSITEDGHIGVLSNYIWLAIHKSRSSKKSAAILVFHR